MVGVEPKLCHPYAEAQPGSRHHGRHREIAGGQRHRIAPSIGHRQIARVYITEITASPLIAVRKRAESGVRFCRGIAHFLGTDRIAGRRHFSEGPPRRHGFPSYGRIFLIEKPFDGNIDEIWIAEIGLPVGHREFDGLNDRVYVLR